MKSTLKATDVANIFMKDILRFRGIPKTIISDWDAKFTSNFWKALFIGFGTQLEFSTTYRPQTDGIKERVNKVLEDMLRMYAMHHPRKWEDYLSLVEFAYKNGYQE
jgi:transposase InsO family protein